jgi:imidazolonepropionase-like amidohydrolase
MKSLLFACGVAAGVALVQAQTPGVIVFEGATLIDAVSAAPIPDAAIEVQNGVITRVGRRGSFPVAASARRIDVTGKTIMPGLINVHSHLASARPAPETAAMPPGGVIERNADRYLYYGVTHVMSLGTDDAGMDAYRRDEDAKPGSGAFVLFAGYGASAKGGWSTNQGVHRPTTREEGREAVRAEVRRHVDAIKFWVDSDHGKLPVLTPDIYGAIIDEAHKNQLKTFCHMFGLEDSKELIRRGLDVMAHSIRDKEVDAEFLSLARQHGTVAVPALVGHASVYVYAKRPAFLDDPGISVLFDKKFIDELGSTKNQAKVAADPRVPVVRAEVAVAMKNAAAMAKAGIPIALGTDMGPVNVLQGIGDHVELEMLVHSGLTPMQAIRAGTINGARVLRLDKTCGSIEKGKSADFIVLSGNPIADITNTRRIESVWFRGQMVDRTALARGTAKATE